MCVCVLGFQGAGGSSYCHHNSHRFLLHCQLCEGGHFGDAGPRLCRHYSRGKTPHLPPDTLWVQTPLLHSLFSNKREVSAAYLEMKVTFIHCLVHKRLPQQGSQCSYDHLYFGTQPELCEASRGTSQSSLLGGCTLFHSLSGWYHTGNYEQALGGWSMFSIQVRFDCSGSLFVSAANRMLSKWWIKIWIKCGFITSQDLLTLIFFGFLVSFGIAHPFLPASLP